MKTAELRKAIKAIDPAARVSKVRDDDDGHWTIRTYESDVVKRVLPSLGLALAPNWDIDFEDEADGDWITVLHVNDEARLLRDNTPDSWTSDDPPKTPAQLDAEIAQALHRKGRR